jgi:hypothetical protein
VNAVNSNSNSNLVTVPPGALILSDVLIGCATHYFHPYSVISA